MVSRSTSTFSSMIQQGKFEQVFNFEKYYQVIVLLVMLRSSTVEAGIIFRAAAFDQYTHGSYNNTKVQYAFNLVMLT